MGAQNAFADLALEHAGVDGDEQMVGGTRVRWRRDFVDTTLAAWDVALGASTGGADWAVNAALGVVTVGMGTSPNAEYSLTSKQKFRLPGMLAVGIKLSQKIVNNEIYVELVSCDSNGNIDETVVAAWRLAGSDSTSTATGRSEIRNGHTARIQSVNLTTATQTSDGVLAIQARTETVSFLYRSIDSNSTYSIGQLKDSQGIDPNAWYKIRLRCKNGSSAPASNTVVTFSFVTYVDFTETRVEVTGGSGSGSPATSVPVSVTNGGGVTSPSLAASSNVTGLTVAKVLAAASTNATSVKNSSARLYGYQLANTSAAFKYVRIYNKASAPTVGTDSPAMVIPIPPGQTIDLDMAVPVALATGFAFAITGAAGDLDATAVAANDVVGYFLYA